MTYLFGQLHIHLHILEVDSLLIHTHCMIFFFGQLHIHMNILTVLKYTHCIFPLVNYTSMYILSYSKSSFSYLNNI